MPEMNGYLGLDIFNKEIEGMTGNKAAIVSTVEDNCGMTGNLPSTLNIYSEVIAKFDA